MSPLTSPLRMAHDLLIVLGVAAFMMGCGSVAAGLSTQLQVMVPAISLASAATENYPSSTALPKASARSRSAAPVAPSLRSPVHEDSREFLAEMTAVMHRRGMPVPAGCRAQQCEPARVSSVPEKPVEDRPASRVKYDLRLYIVDMAQSIRRR